MKVVEADVPVQFVPRTLPSDCATPDKHLASHQAQNMEMVTQ